LKEHAYWMPPPHAHGSSWAAPLAAAMWRAQLARRCPYTSNAPVDGELVFQQFVARYAAVRELPRRRFQLAGRGRTAKLGDVVLVDSRPNVWSVLSELVTLDNLRPGAWGLTVFCSARNADFMREALMPHVEHDGGQPRFVPLPELDVEPFDLEAYNRLLKSETFWARLEQAEPATDGRALLVQDDGMLVRRGLEDVPELMARECEYVGAPWADAEQNKELRELLGGDGSRLVGNGGLSLRSVPAMRRICRERAAEGRRLFFHRLQPVPEDVFVAKEARTPTAAEAARFAWEQRPPPASSASGPALGFHKPWGYHAASVVAGFMQAALAEAELRVVSDLPIIFPAYQ
jgi:hypothetical protein